MRFIDEAKIRVSSGHGGPGSVSFRRETFVPRGGPDGGDGGAGADIIFKASSQLGSLQDFRFRRVYQGPSGMHGSGANKTGRAGEDIIIPVPVGTIIRDTETNEILVDLSEDGATWVACEGGRGGKGNAHFATSTHQAPKFAQPGEEGESRALSLELKLLADVGILGFPNAGKSTLISRMSAAKPKIADYPFTTLTPHLGVVSLPDLRTFIIADIPGLVEGAHEGIGLGHRFLRHLERTRLFIHLLDGTQLLEDATGAGPESFEAAIQHMLKRYQAIRKELELFNKELLHHPEIVVINKLDLLESDPDLIAKARKTLRERITSIRGSHPVADEPYIISAYTGKGVENLTFLIDSELRAQRGLDHPTLKIALPDDEGLRS